MAGGAFAIGNGEVALATPGSGRANARSAQFATNNFPRSIDKIAVEHRRESRLQLSKNVSLRVGSLMGELLGQEPMIGRVVDVSGSGMRLELPLPVPCGAAVEIEDEHTLILGKTLRCDLQGHVYIVAVSVSKTTPVS